MYLRVALSGTTATPTLQLRAGTGAAVTLSGVPSTVLRGPNPVTDYVGDAWTVTETAHVTQVVVGFHADTTETWQLGITNTDTAHDALATFVVADTLPETAQPWVALPHLAFDALIGATTADSVQVANRGTTDVTVTVGALPPPLTVTTTLPLTVPAGDARTLAFRFAAPGAVGLTTVDQALGVSPDDTTAAAGVAPHHTKTLHIDAVTQKLEIALLLDDSGSMSWNAQGNTVPPAQSRWSELVSGCNQLLDTLTHFCAGRGTFGIARFPAPDPSNPSSFDLVAGSTPIPNQAGIGGAQSAVAAVVPFDSTPMGDGLARVVGPTSSFFAADRASRDFDRRHLVVMSDGANNTGGDPTDFIAPKAGPTTSLAGQRIALSTVGYGLREASNVDLDLLSRLAAGSLDGGHTYAVDVDTITATELAAAFRNILKNGLSTLSAPADPDAVFRSGQVEARHPVLLTEHDGRVAAVLAWNTPDAARLRLELLTPTCEVITPENAGRGQFADVHFRNDERHQAYYLGPDVLRNPGDPAAPRYGTWTLRVTRPTVIELAAAGPGDENYSYDVIAESELDLHLGTRAATHYAGDPIEVSARLTADGLPVTGASVVVSTQAPTRAAANWLAGLTVPADALAQAARQLAGQDSTPLLVKALGAQIAGFRFDPGLRRDDLVMTDDDGDGTYRATVAGTSTPEHRTLYVTAQGITDQGRAFRREGRLEIFVRVRPEPGFTALAVGSTGAGTANVLVIPKDRFGNVLLADPTTIGFDLLVDRGRFTGPLTSNLDGTYNRPLALDSGGATTVTLRFDGNDVVSRHPVVRPEDLSYVNRVIRFSPGLFPDANQFADPAAALGTVVGKPADRFVALGAGGTLTLALEELDILARGDDDVTVFMPPEGERRSYEVLAFDVRARSWVPLGTSIGVTQGFGLAAAGLTATRGIRVRDTSGRARGDDRAPLSAPGVGVRGVGVRHVGGHRRYGGRWCWCLAWLRRLLSSRRSPQ